MRLAAFAILTCATMLAGCASNPPLATARSVDLPQFMGPWFVHAHIPASPEVNAHNAVESYELHADGQIMTTYTFRDGGFDAPLVTLTPTGYVEDEASNATWGMQFFWPFTAEYLIAHLSPDYQETIIARSARDYAWIMTRSPSITEAQLSRLTQLLVEMGYDTTDLRRVPHRWPDPSHPNARAARD